VEANRGVNTAPATIDTMTGALQSELTSGPLANLNSGTDTRAQFLTDVGTLLTDFNANVDSQLLPRFPNVDAIIKLQGAAVQSELAALDAQETSGLISSSEFATGAGTAINTLTSGPLFPLNTPVSGFASATQTLIDQLNTLPPTLATGATPSLSVAQVKTVATADADAYEAAAVASLYGNPWVEGQVKQAVSTFETSVSNLSTTSSTAQTELSSAISALDSALLDSTGLFGPLGPLKRS
jgi:hypothetical protein